jgi:hypothetical protein
MSNQFEYVTAREFAKMCKVSLAAVRVWRKQRIGPQPVIVGHLSLYRRDEAEEWAKNYIPFYTRHKMAHPERYR